MSEEWGPWIEHDGRGCTCVGSLVDVLSIRNRLGETAEHRFIAEGGLSWTWKLHNEPVSKVQRIIRYRIRKPRGMMILENLIADLPAPSLDPSPINETAPREELPV